MAPDKTAPIGTVWFGSTLFVEEFHTFEAKPLIDSPTSFNKVPLST